MDVPPVEYNAFRINLVFAFPFAQAVINTAKVGYIRYIDLLCTSIIRIYYCIFTDKRRFTAYSFFFIIVFVSYRISSKEKDNILVYTLGFFFDSIVL